MVKFSGFEDQYVFRQEYDPNKRDYAYYYNNVAAFYSEYLKSSTMIGWNGLYNIEYLRAMAEGRNPRVIINEDETTSRKSAILDVNGNPIQYDPEIYPIIDWTSEVWDVLSPANKIMNALLGKLLEHDYEISADPLDYNTRHETEINQLKRWQYTQDRKRIQFASKLAGIQYPEPDFLPENPDDLNEYIDEFLPAHVLYLEQVVKHSFDISAWEPNIQILFYRDLLTTNKACVKIEYDQEDGKEKPIYVNINTADTQKSDYIDCHDNERSWHFYLISISQLRQYFPNKDEDFFKGVAGQYAGFFNNPSSAMFTNYVIQNPYGGWGYDAFKVCIGNFEWVDINRTKQVIGKNKWGRETITEPQLDSSVASDRVIRFKDERTLFSAKWVVGTKDIFEYGPAQFVTYPSKNDTETTYKWINLPGKSIMEQLIPILKNFQDLWEKYRELLRNAQGKIEFIDVDKLASTVGQSDNPQEAAKKAFRRLLSTNKMLFRRVNSAGMPDQNLPIAETAGGMGLLFTEISTAINMNISLVEYITGINPLAFGQSPDPNAPVTTTQMAMAATNNAIRPMLVGYMTEKKRLSETLARKINVRVRGSDYSRKSYAMVIGDDGIKALIAANKSEAEYGIKLAPRPTEIEKQWLLQNLNIATNPQQGEREISTADANVILNMIMSNSPVKTVQRYFEKARRRQRDRILAGKKELMQEQSLLNQQDSKFSAEQASNIQQEKLYGEIQKIIEKNKGTVENTVLQESIRKDKEQSIQEIKNQKSNGKD